MSIFDRLRGGPARDPAAEAREEERRAQSVRNLEGGGLPVNAIERLEEQRRRQGTDKHFFTSNLTANEFLLTMQSGFAPLGQVMGSTVYHIGYQWRTGGWSNSAMWGGGASYELEVLTAANCNARALAFTRLAQEAALLGATGVLGVRLTRRVHEWGEDLLEFAAVGTAIRESEIASPASGGASHPLFLSDLSAQDFTALRRGGFRPVGIASGNCTFYQIPTWNTQRATGGGLFSSWQNQELRDFTQALYQTRELAMDRMLREAMKLGGTGIVGVATDIDVKPVEFEAGNDQKRIDMMYDFTALGTVIAPIPGATPGPAPEVAVVLTDRRPDLSE